MAYITGFRVGDGDALVELWARAAPRDALTADRLRNLVLLDANFDPAGLRLAWDGAALVGAAYAVRRQVAMVGDDLEPARGWIPFFFVDPGSRGQGIGRRVVTDAMDWLRHHGRTEVDFASYTPNYVLPGLDRAAYPAAAALLGSLGFTTLYQACAMDLGLVDYALPDETRLRLADLHAEGYTFGPPTRDELVALVALAHHHFNPDWGRVIRESVTAGLPLDRIVVAREPGGELIGWGMFAAYDGMVERFGPFGVASERRGLGLGGVLLHLCLTRMRALGAHTAWFLWTGEKSPAGQLYLKTGFTITRRFDVLRAPLT